MRKVRCRVVDMSEIQTFQFNRKYSGAHYFFLLNRRTTLVVPKIFYEKSHLTLSFGHDAAYAFHFLLRGSIQVWSRIVFSGYLKPQGELSSSM